MVIIGLDYHPSFQQIAFVDQETGEFGEKRLVHGNQEAESFYRELKKRGVSVRVGMEATGHARWFEELMTELGFELWIGDPAQIKAKRVRKQKNDRDDARLLLQLLAENRFPKVWVPSVENRDLRQLLWHRHRLVQMRTRIMNQLQAVAMNEGVRRKKGLWSKSGRAQLEAFLLAPWATRRRKDLLELLDRLNPTIAELSTAIEQEAKKQAAVVRLMTHPGVPAYRAGFRPDYWTTPAFSLWETDWKLSGTDSLRRLQRWQTAAGSYQQARQLAHAFLAGGGGSNRSSG